MRICYIVSNLKRVGPIQQLFFIIKYLDISRFNVIIITLSPEPEDTLIATFRNSGVEVKSIGKKSKVAGLFYCLLNLNGILGNCNIDVVHSYGLRANAVSVLCLRNYQIISTVREYPYLQYPLNYGKGIGHAVAWLYMRVLKACSQLVSCSDDISQKIAGHGLSSKVINNGIDLENFYPVKDGEKRTIRKKLCLPENSMIMISVGDLINRKNPELVVKAFLDSSLPGDVSLLFVGDGPLLGKLQQLSGSNNNIIFAGKTSDVREYLWASDFYVSASKAEGFPNAVLEALACGLPVCLSDIGPHKEMLEPSPDAGILFGDNSMDSLKYGMERLVVNSKQMREAAVFLAIDNYSAQKMSREYQTLYETLDD